MQTQEELRPDGMHWRTLLLLPYFSDSTVPRVLCPPSNHHGSTGSELVASSSADGDMEDEDGGGMWTGKHRRSRRILKRRCELVPTCRPAHPQDLDDGRTPDLDAEGQQGEAAAAAAEKSAALLRVWLL